MADRLLPIVGTVLGTVAGTAIGQPQLGAIAGGALGGLGQGAIRGNPLQGLASGAIGGAGSAFGANLLGNTIGGQLGKVLPELPVESIAGPPSIIGGTDALFEAAAPSSLFNSLVDPSGFINADPLAGAPLLDPAQSTGLFGFSSNQIGRGVGGLIGGGLAGGVANQLIQGGGPPAPTPPRLPANLGPLPGAPPDLQRFVVRTGGGLPRTLEELLRRR